MKTYPSIPTTVDRDRVYDIFDKLDGSNIRAEWRPGQGFHRFGSRRLLLPEDGPLAPARALIREKYGVLLDRRFRDRGYAKATCFFEYFGPNSFAGEHVDSPSAMDVVLIDVNPHRKGLLGPQAFLDLCGDLPVPRYLGRQRLDDGFIEAVRDGALSGVSFEGVVCKSGEGHQLRMTKIKSRAWLARLRAICPDERQFRARC